MRWRDEQLGEELRAAEGEREHAEISAFEDWPGGDEEADGEGGAETGGDPEQPEQADAGMAEGACADVHMSEAGPSSWAGHTTPAGERADVRTSEAGPSGEAGHATPAGARADAAATPTRTGDSTPHMHSVAGTAKRRQKQKGQRKRGRDRAEAELASVADGPPAKRVLSAPPRDQPDDDTELT